MNRCWICGKETCDYKLSVRQFGERVLENSLSGRSLQMACAIFEDNAAKALAATNGELFMFAVMKFEKGMDLMTSCHIYQTFEEKHKICQPHKATHIPPSLPTTDYSNFLLFDSLITHDSHFLSTLLSSMEQLCSHGQDQSASR